LLAVLPSAHGCGADKHSSRAPSGTASKKRSAGLSTQSLISPASLNAPATKRVITYSKSSFQAASTSFSRQCPLARWLLVSCLYSSRASRTARSAWKFKNLLCFISILE